MPQILFTYKPLHAQFCDAERILLDESTVGLRFNDWGKASLRKNVF
jgi:hypothetical protein